MLRIASLDHLVITCKDVQKSIEFYSKLGMTVETFGNDNRKALKFGTQKINLHQFGNEFEPKANNPTVGSQDLCFIIEGSIDEAQKHLKSQEIAVIEGPVRRTGAQGSMMSIYCRDVDDNLIELASYKE